MKGGVSMGKLTVKQVKFVEEYVKTGNAYQSAIKAGYSEGYAKGSVNKLLENNGVKKAIEKRMESLQKKSIASQEEILQILTSVARGEVVDLSESDSERFGKQQSSAIKNADRVKAAELLGKRYGMWTERVEVATNTEVSKLDSIIEQLKD